MTKRRKKEPTNTELLNEKIQAYKNVSLTPSGEIVLADLKKKFSAGCFELNKSSAIDPYRTHVDLGKFMVFAYIEAQINRELIEEQENA